MVLRSSQCHSLCTQLEWEAACAGGCGRLEEQGLAGGKGAVLPALPLAGNVERVAAVRRHIATTGAGCEPVPCTKAQRPLSHSCDAIAARCCHSM